MPLSEAALRTEGRDHCINQIWPFQVNVAHFGHGKSLCFQCCQNSQADHLRSHPKSCWQGNQFWKCRSGLLHPTPVFPCSKMFLQILETYLSHSVQRFYKNRRPCKSFTKSHPPFLGLSRDLVSHAISMFEYCMCWICIICINKNYIYIHVNMYVYRYVHVIWYDMLWYCMNIWYVHVI